VKRARLLIIDKREIFREGLALLLQNRPDIEAVLTANGASEAIKKAREGKTDVILINMEPEQDNVVEATQSLCQDLPGVGILILSHSEAESDLMSAVRAGARGYVAKSISTDDLVKTISLVSGGGVIVSAPMATKMMSEIGSEPQEEKKKAVDYKGLTEREKDVLQLVARGASNKEIADNLYISENTVKVHLRNIMHKWQVHGRLKAMALAHERGFRSDTEEAPDG